MKKNVPSIKKMTKQFFFTLFLIITILTTFAPVILHFYGDFILEKLFFQTWSRYYPWIDLTKVNDFNLNGVNIYEQTEINVTIGIWYVLPSKVKLDHSLLTLSDHLNQYIESDDRPIIMYLHGQDGTRGTYYRSNHYRAMTAAGYHIIALDYRGYGDSTGIPTVEGVIHDVLHVFNVIRRVRPENPIIIWGHSMGTGVASLTMKHLFENSKNLNKPAGLVLEAPFYNAIEALISYPITRILKINPYFVQSALDAFAKLDINFPNNEIVSILPLPIVILHSEDDGIIPYYHSKLIIDYVKTHRDKILPDVHLVTVPSSENCGHNHIYSYGKFQDIIKDFEFLKHASQL